MLKIVGDEKAVVSVRFLRRGEYFKKNSVVRGVIAKAVKEIREYFRGKRKRFSVKFSLRGTPFQQNVWKELRGLSFGQTVCYEVIARRMGKPRAVRAVGTAIGKNPLAIIIPCHRVISKSGSPGNYAGGLFRKRWLLNHEKN